MKKLRISTLLLFLPALLMVFGGWYFTKWILKYKETQLLAKTGQLQVADSGYSLLKEDSPADDTTQDTSEAGTFQAETLSEDMTAQILAYWEAAAYWKAEESAFALDPQKGQLEMSQAIFSHEPRKGQLTMKQAIDTGRTWITRMSEKGLFPASLAENNFLNVNAVLCTLDENTDIPGRLLSCWQILYVQDSIRVHLTIHAASAQIWKAEIFADSSCLPIPVYSDDALLTAAFPFLSEGSMESAEQIESGLYRIRKYSPEEKIYATIKWTQISKDGKDQFVGFTVELHSANL